MENIRVTSQKPDLASWAKITQDAHGARPRTCCDITCCWRAFPSAAWRSSRRMPDVKVDTQLQYSCLHMAATKARQASLPPGRPPSAPGNTQAALQLPCERSLWARVQRKQRLCGQEGTGASNHPLTQSLPRSNSQVGITSLSLISCLNFSQNVIKYATFQSSGYLTNQEHMSFFLSF